MEEEAIAAKLRENIAPAQDPVVKHEQIENMATGEATIAPVYELDEMTQYKLHDLFHATYDPNDETTKQQLSYIWQEVSAMIPEQDYGFVAAKIRELQRIAGITNSEGRIYRLYQWLKLNNMRRNAEAEMGALSDG
jgi:hypothetical protein